MVNVTIECCGASKRWCGTESITLQLRQGQTVGDVLDALAELFADFAVRRQSVAIAMGESIIPSSTLIADGDLIALIPPVSAG